MKSKILLCNILILILSFTTANAQNGKQEYTGSIERNDPENAKNLDIWILPVIVDVYSLNLNFAYSAGLSYRFNNIATAFIDYKKAYLDRIHNDVNVGSVCGTAQNGLSALRNFTFGGQIYLKKSADDAEQTVHVKSSGNTDYRAKLTAKRLEMWGIDLAYSSFNTFIESENGNLNFNGYQYGDPAKKDTVFAGNLFNSMMKCKFITIGVRCTRISDIVLKLDGEGKKSLEARGELYGDLVIGSGFKFDDLLVTHPDLGSGSPSYTQRYVLQDQMTVSKVGFRVGFQETVIHRFNSTYGLEFGLRPGPKSGSDNLYLMFKFGFNFSAKL